MAGEYESGKPLSRTGIQQSDGLAVAEVVRLPPKHERVGKLTFSATTLRRAHSSLPYLEVEFELPPLQEYTPVHKEESTDDQQTDNGSQNSLQGKSAVQEVRHVTCRVLPGEDQHGVADEFSAKERRNRSHRVHPGNGCGGEQGRRGKRRQGVHEDEQPTHPEFLSESLPEELQFLFLVTFDDLVGELWDIETENVS